MKKPEMGKKKLDTDLDDYFSKKGADKPADGEAAAAPEAGKADGGEAA